MFIWECRPSELLLSVLADWTRAGQARWARGTGPFVPLLPRVSPRPRYRRGRQRAATSARSSLQPSGLREQVWCLFITSSVIGPST